MDGNGSRVKQVYNNGTRTVTSYYFMGGLYEVTSGNAKKYYSIAGMTVAMNDGSGLKYLLTDHLGSVVAVTDSTGTLTSQQRYYPFGQVRTDVTSPNPQSNYTDFGYTGQRDVSGGLGLMDYHARMYDSYLNRFIQPDTIVEAPYNPQEWNRYSYVLNNPIILVDPAGHQALAAAELLVLGTFVAVGAFALLYKASPQFHEFVDQTANAIDNLVNSTKNYDDKFNTSKN